MKHTITIIGYGRFGECMALWLKDFFDVLIVSQRTLENLPEGIQQCSFEQAVQKTDSIFYCPSISELEHVLKNHAPILSTLQKPLTLIDCLSIKLLPQKLFQTFLPNTHHTIIHSHPMFGPDSVKKNGGVQNLPMVIWSPTLESDTYLYWKNFFHQQALRIVEISPDQHDRYAARSQGVTHFIGRILHEFGMERTPIDTMGASILNDLMEQTCRDSWQLFEDLQNLNPYTNEMREEIGKAYHHINQLLKKTP